VQARAIFLSRSAPAQLRPVAIARGFVCDADRQGLTGRLYFTLTADHAALTVLYSVLRGPNRSSAALSVACRAAE
jgi:hypothetical protein